jgi:NAD+ synthase (glutamine-hydrolysing)
MRRPLRIALAQLNVTVGDLSGNVARIQAAIRQAFAWEADLLVAPELALCGYPPEDLLLKEDFVQAAQRALESLARGVSGLTVIVGCIDRSPGGKLHNAAAVLANGRIRAVYHKQYLPNYGVFDEKRYFTPGRKPLILPIAGVRTGILICEDLWEASPSRVLAARGCELAVNLSASPYHAGKSVARQRLFAPRARENRLAIAFCNLVGGQDELVFDGASLVLDSAGRRIAQGLQFKEDLVLADLAPRHIRRRRASVSGAASADDRHPLPKRRLRHLSGPAEVYEALVLGILDYVRKNRFSTVVLGLSGGVDSALTACIAADALGSGRVVGVVMPSRYSSRATQADARRLARALGIRCLEAPIEPLFGAYLSATRRLFTAAGGPAVPGDVTEQNLQARIRGNLLMALSNRYGWLVLTTGNKSETATGYCTLYGDMAGGFAVIKDVHKTMVYDLARYRNRLGPGSPIARSILKRPPTAELAPRQTDQDTLPPYAVLDRILKAYVEQDKGVAAVIRGRGADAQTARKVIHMVDRSEYKRRQAPPGIKITPKAFGRDRRMPITNRWID